MDGSNSMLMAAVLIGKPANTVDPSMKMPPIAPNSEQRNANDQYPSNYNTNASTQ